MKTTIKTGSIEGFFKRGREIARSADKAKPISAERVIVYEDPEDLARILTAAKIALFRAIKERPGSITDIAARVKRDRSAVKRDIDDLERAGLVSVEEKPHPGHGRLKEVRAAADRVVLEAVFAQRRRPKAAGPHRNPCLHRRHPGTARALIHARHRDAAT